jgi:hypothetical protein
MDTIQRITTTYLENEDRIRLVGENARGETIIIWLTRRLLDRLLPVLLTTIDNTAEADNQHELIQGFAQHAAVSGIPQSRPIIPKSESASWVAISIDVAHKSDGVDLSFKDEQKVAMLSLDRILLRQWLGIVYMAYEKAEWDTDMWPSWFSNDISTDNMLH